MWWAMRVLAVIAASAAMIVLATQASGEMLDYGVGIVPVAVPWLTAGLAVAVAVVGPREQGASSTIGSLLIGALLVLTAWSIVMLPFDILRVVGLVPLPLAGWGLVLRLLLLVAGAAALIPVLQTRRAHQQRCPVCGRVMPGSLDRLPRWPILVGLVAALVYPVLRVVWALGGTFGTTGEPLDLDAVVAWGVVVPGAMPVLLALVLLVDKGPAPGRTLFGLGGVALGAAMTAVGALAASRVVSELATEGLGSSQDDGLMTWAFLLVYGSWFVAGMGIMAGSWRYWAHRRDECPRCRISPVVDGRTGSMGARTDSEAPG